MRLGRGFYGFAAAGTAFFAACVVFGQTAPKDPWSQGWNEKDRTSWYSADQGSRLIPESWFYALEQPGGDKLFLDRAYIGSFHYLPGDGSNVLPIGFAVDIQDDSHFVDTHLRWEAGQGAKARWVGMTCAACHTNDIQVGGRVQRVQGGSTLADFQGFIEAFDLALLQTRDDPAKFARFAAKVLKHTPTAEESQRLHAALYQLVKLRLKTDELNQTAIRYGPARLDAVGYIFNKVELAANPSAPSAPAPDAPVSYPFLWNVAQQTQIQWDGVAKNTPLQAGNSQVLDVGAAGRNMAEVTGVFGDIIIPADASKPLITSIHLDNLVSMEQLLMKLEPPLWPRDQFPVDAALAAEGAGLYKSQCAGCHFELAHDDLKTRYRPADAHGNKTIPIERMSYFNPQSPDEGPPADTDPWMACNAVLNTAPAGQLTGRKTGIAQYPVFQPTSPMTHMLTYTVVQELLTKKGVLALAGIESFANLHPGPKVFRELPLVGAAPGVDFARIQRLHACKIAASRPANYKLFAYKARPLNGVWATGPYLHNGSVPTLYALLLPPAERPTSFGLGSRKLDPKRVGFDTTAGGDNSFTFQVNDANGEGIPGNSNAGHDYDNAKLTDHQRWAIVEYLKVIGEK